MKKKSIKKQKAPAYIFGLTEGQTGEIASYIGSVGNSVGSVGTSIGNAADDTSKAAVAGSAFSGLGQGAGIGSQIGGAIGGPEGQVIGAQIGAVGGLVGGIFTGIKKRQQALRRERRAFQAKETQAGLDNQAQFEQEYWNDNGLAYSFENGGVLPNVAWVDNNEILRDNNGNIVQVPNTKPGTDNHLINSTTLESVLSDKLKRPGTNKTFAQEGEKLTKMTKGSKGKDKFAKASDELNKLHANQMYNTLLSEQAVVKAKKGIKPKVKGVAPAYEKGKNGVFFDTRNNAKFDSNGNYLGKIDSTVYSPYEMDMPIIPINNTLTIDKKNNVTDNLNTKLSTVDTSLGTAKKYTPSPDIMSDIASEYVAQYSNVFPGVEITPQNSNLQKGIKARADYYNSLFPGQIPEDQLIALQTAANKADGITGETILIGGNDINTSNSTNNLSNPKDTAVIGSNVITTTSGKKKRVSSTPVVTKQKTPLALTKPINTPTLPTVNKGIDLTPINAGLPKVINHNSQLNAPNNLLSKLDFDPNIATLAAGLFAKPEYESQVYNPYAGAVNRALARRKINIEPTLAANRRSRAINNRNLANISPNTGANLAARTQSAVSEYAQNADLYANRDNANNQYLADAANMMNNLGQQFAQNAVYTNDINARNRAAARSARNRSIENYNKWYQNKQLMKNQMERDKALYPLLKDYLSYGIKNELLTGLDTRYDK